MMNIIQFPTVRLSIFTREPAGTQRATHCIPWYMLYDFDKKITLNLNRVTKITDRCTMYEIRNTFLKYPSTSALRTELKEEVP